MAGFLILLNIMWCKLACKPIFIIALQNGTAKKIMGTVKSTFITDCADIAKRNGISHGIVYAVKGPYGKPVLQAAGKVSAEVLQQLRNTWMFTI